MKRVLLVDDAAFMRMMLSNILINNGYEIAGEAENGKIAIEKYKELSPDIVTMDITMSEMNGLDAAREIKKYDSNANIIMCSAMGQQAMIIEAIENGAKDFITKPFSVKRVLEALEKCS